MTREEQEFLKFQDSVAVRYSIFLQEDSNITNIKSEEEKTKKRCNDDRTILFTNPR